MGSMLSVNSDNFNDFISIVKPIFKGNSSVRIVLSIIFIIVIYSQVIRGIFKFFGVSQSVTEMYSAWLGIFMLFISILPYERSIFKIDSD